jgi:hypothetical protein
MFASYWERGVKVAESVGVYVYVRAVIRRGLQVCVCVCVCVFYAMCHVICVHNSSLTCIIMLVIINL